jgi:hypothetical protein
MDANIDNEDENQLAALLERIAADDKRKHLKIISVLERKEEFSFRNRNKMDELIQQFLDNLQQFPVNLGYDQHQQLTAEQERIADDTAAAAAAKRRRLLKLISVLERKEHFPLFKRDEIDILIREFLFNLGDDVHDMICDDTIDAGDYRGLDSDRDTEAEIETAVRFFPDVLSRRGRFNLYPIQLLVFTLGENMIRCNLKAVSFIPIAASLALELGLFEEEERGGLLFENDFGKNILHDLMTGRHNREHHEAADDKYLQVLIKLREMGLLKKEDIKTYDLLNVLSSQSQCDYFAEKRFRFLVEWDPNALLHPNRGGHLPIHYVAYRSSIRGFKLVFEYGIRYYPKKKGIHLLFHKNDNFSIQDTPFQIACDKLGYEKVMEVVEDTLARHSDTPINVAEALVSAAIDKNIQLDCVYFLLLRQPDILQTLLSQSSATVAATNNNNNNNDETYETSNLANNKLNSTTTERKRKREL